VQITNIGSLPASPVNVEVQAKENTAETSQAVDYVKIQEMIRLSIESALGKAGGGIDKQSEASPLIEMIDIPYNIAGAKDD
jgi:hypothetical protein